MDCAGTNRRTSSNPLHPLHSQGGRTGSSDSDLVDSAVPVTETRGKIGLDQSVVRSGFEPPVFCLWDEVNFLARGGKILRQKDEERSPSDR